MAQVLDNAKKRVPPERLKWYGEDHPIILLANVCGELQDWAGEGPFYLSARKAGELLGVPQMTAWRYLRNLERDKILVVAERG